MKATNPFSLDHENWEIPYIESYFRGGGNQKIDSWLNALLCEFLTSEADQVTVSPICLP